MKYINLLLFSLFAFLSLDLSAQHRFCTFNDSELYKGASLGVYDNADTNKQELTKSERRKLLRERNIINGGVAFIVTQAGFDNWAKGGENYFAGKITVDLNYVHKVDRMTMETKLDARYGMNIIDGDAFKNEDKFTLNNQLSWSISERWSYSGILNIRSQFTKGYASRSDKTIKSNFMSPGHIDIALGFKLKGPKSPLTLTMSPITGSITTMMYKPLRDIGGNGVEPGHTTKSQLGSSIQMDFAHTFFKKKVVCKSYFYTFYDYSMPANVRWTNTVEILATNFITTTLYCDMIYDESVKTPRDDSSLQFNYTLGLSLTKKFSNQKK